MFDCVICNGTVVEGVRHGEFTDARDTVGTGVV